MGYGQRNKKSCFPITYYLLPITYHLLPIACLFYAILTDSAEGATAFYRELVEVLSSPGGIYKSPA